MTHIFLVPPGSPVAPHHPVTSGSPVVVGAKCPPPLEEAFLLDAAGLPACTDSRVHFTAWEALAGLPPARREELVGFWRRRSAGVLASEVARRSVEVPGGEVTLGTDRDAPWHYWGEDPAHPARLDAFRIGTVPVTNALYRCMRPEHDLPAADDLPAVHVTWYDAVMFARWVGARLPREAEWEAAARCGRAEPHGDIRPADLVQHAWYSENSRGQVHEVGLLRPNAWGVHDLFGNVWEWCDDSYDPSFYGRAEFRNPFNNDDSLPDRVSRGGSLHSFAEMCRSAFRNHEPADYSAYDIGFRLAFGPVGSRY